MSKPLAIAIEQKKGTKYKYFMVGILVGFIISFSYILTINSDYGTPHRSSTQGTSTTVTDPKENDPITQNNEQGTDTQPLPEEPIEQPEDLLDDKPSDAESMFAEYFSEKELPGDEGYIEDIYFFTDFTIYRLNIYDRIFEYISADANHAVDFFRALIVFTSVGDEWDLYQGDKTLIPSEEILSKIDQIEKANTVLNKKLKEGAELSIRYYESTDITEKNQLMEQYSDIFSDAYRDSTTIRILCGQIQYEIEEKEESI